MSSNVIGAGGAVSRKSPHQPKREKVPPPTAPPPALDLINAAAPSTPVKQQQQQQGQQQALPSLAPSPSQFASPPPSDDRREAYAPAVAALPLRERMGLVPSGSATSTTSSQSSSPSFQTSALPPANSAVVIGGGGAASSTSNATTTTSFSSSLSSRSPVPQRAPSPFSSPPTKASSSDLSQLIERAVALIFKSDSFMLFLCFLGIMSSFLGYGIMLEYATSGGRRLHELSFLFVTSALYTLTASIASFLFEDSSPEHSQGPSVHPSSFALLACTSMGSTFCSVRSLRYVIYPIQILAKSCKPVPVMFFGTLLGKRYPLKKYLNVGAIIAGVVLFMGGGDGPAKKGGSDGGGGGWLGLALLFVSLCFDGGTGAYEDKLMSTCHVGPFALMYNIQLGKTILAGAALIVFDQVDEFAHLCKSMGFLLVGLGVTGAVGQVFIFLTISKFGALTCAIIGLARKVATLAASIYIYKHPINALQGVGLTLCVGMMVAEFGGKKGGEGHGHGGNQHKKEDKKDGQREDNVEMKSLLGGDDIEEGDNEEFEERKGVGANRKVIGVEPIVEV